MDDSEATQRRLEHVERTESAGAHDEARARRERSDLKEVSHVSSVPIEFRSLGLTGATGRRS